MPVRKIPKNYLFVTGKFASRKVRRMVGFESTLEKDYQILVLSAVILGQHSGVNLGHWL